MAEIDLTILQPGQKLPALAGYPGDFADWILAGMGREPKRARLVYPHRGDALPPADEPGAVVITGSGAMVTAGDAWMQRSADWLAQAVAAGRPVLGICFGHQLLAHALGGRVLNNPRGVEVGTVPLALEPAAVGDPLFSGLAEPLRVHVSHLQSVTELPPGARRLAGSEMDPNQAFVWGERVWGVQFHPEFSAAVARAYLEFHSATLRAQGRDPGAIAKTIADTPSGSGLLRNFARLAGLV
jgi:GMP synthase (glutamine-hydrolysing)